LRQRTLNLGILAHVDAGKTTLTERLLYAAGVIDEIGSVDAGTTQTDSLALERQRGITIKSAVVSFAIDDVTVNLTDTPGHPDFIAEVERVLSILDGAVLVISAVEGVQAQTRVLMRALRRLRIPTLLFVNKIDRPGASEEQTLRAISERMALAPVPMGSTSALGTRAADFKPWDEKDTDFRAGLAEALAERDDGMLAAYLDGEAQLPYRRLRLELAAQTERMLVHPVFFGSAITGAGVESLMAGIAELLPATGGEAQGPVTGTVFKIERGDAGEKVAYARMFSGTVRVRDRLVFGPGKLGKVNAIRVFENGSLAPRTEVSAGEIAKLWGLDEIQIGDRLGQAGADETHHQFAPPALESVVVARRPGDGARLRLALGQLAEQDPLISVRQDDTVNELSVSLYGEVQKEVIQATLASDFGIDVTFRQTTTICVERPAGSGEAIEVLFADGNPFPATLGLRVDPAPIESGVEFRLAVDIRSVPLYLYKTADIFVGTMTEYVRSTLQEGLLGWRVADCTVTLTDCGYYVGDGAKRGSRSIIGGVHAGTSRTTAADFRKLTPLVLMRALERAGTVVCEPMVRARVEIPTDAVSAVLATVARLGGVVMGAPSFRGDLCVTETWLPASRAQDLQRQLSGLTGGEGVVETRFGGYRQVSGSAPIRRRTTANPLDRDAYMMQLARHAIGSAHNRGETSE
jgi:ribosomal protection tetracycline resistance protein